MASVWTIILSLFGGVAGSAFLELWWKPTRARARFATTVGAEIKLNLARLRVAQGAVQRHPELVPDAISFSTVGFGATVDGLRELPADLSEDVLDLYSKYEVMAAIAAAWRSLPLAGNNHAGGQLLSRQRSLAADFSRQVDPASALSESVIEKLREVALTDNL